MFVRQAVCVKMRGVSMSLHYEQKCGSCFQICRGSDKRISLLLCYTVTLALSENVFCITCTT